MKNEMKNNQWKFTMKTIGALCLLCAGIFFVSAATNGNERKIEGSWKANVTAVNPPVGSFTELITFAKEGNVNESRRLYVPESPFGSLLETPGHGVWEKVGPRDYQVNFIFLLEGAPDNPTYKGQPLGTDNISLRVTVSQDGSRLTGTFRSQAKDEAGNLVFVVDGNYAATRIEAVP